MAYAPNRVVRAGKSKIELDWGYPMNSTCSKIVDAPPAIPYAGITTSVPGLIRSNA